MIFVPALHSGILSKQGILTQPVIFMSKLQINLCLLGHFTCVALTFEGND